MLKRFAKTLVKIFAGLVLLLFVALAALFLVLAVEHHSALTLPTPSQLINVASQFPEAHAEQP